MTPQELVEGGLIVCVNRRIVRKAWLQANERISPPWFLPHTIPPGTCPFFPAILLSPVLGKGTQYFPLPLRKKDLRMDSRKPKQRTRARDSLWLTSTSWKQKLHYFQFVPVRCWQALISILLLRCISFFSFSSGRFWPEFLRKITNSF